MHSGVTAFPDIPLLIPNPTSKDMFAMFVCLFFVNNMSGHDREDSNPIYFFCTHVSRGIYLLDLEQDILL